MERSALRRSRQTEQHISASVHARLGLRLRVRLRRWRLDRALADGCGWEDSKDHALRARQLLDPVARCELAASLRRLVAEAENPRVRLLSSAVPAHWGVVRTWREALLGLAERLERPVPTNPCGVARTLELLTDGTGALYNPAPKRPMAETIWWIADGLRPCPPHDWRCPVRMKLDPDHVAWTCARCGNVATTSAEAADAGPAK